MAYSSSSSSASGARPMSPFASMRRYNNSHDGGDSSLVDDCLASMRRAWHNLWRWWTTRGRRTAGALLLQAARQLGRNLTTRRVFNLPHALVLVWAVVLLWGERWVFHTTVERCAWGNWEKWPTGVTPHHLIFVADPQLIDPHSYPGRPWPINSLTVLITDNYMRRSYSQLQQQLHPDTVFFLGDLFDGGREWRTSHGDSQDPEWNHRPAAEVGYAKKWKKKYGQDYWLKEYARFGKIFTRPWNSAGREPAPGQRGRKLIASLPGNHDLGFGSEVKIPVRTRFEAYFGDVNRVDVIANHTFVSVDSVSLSARSSEDKGRADLSGLYKPTEEFLNQVQWNKRKAVERELRHLRGETDEVMQIHRIEELDQANFADLPKMDPGEGKAELPTILLTHVPLYRPPGTPCGPMREHWPPSKPAKGQLEPLTVDHRNAISVSKGYQYQNVVGEEDSIDLLKKVGNVVHAFSGDDHDYCELTHAESQGSVKEITVKSISMAMGVPTPGFLMMSMYNPIDGEGKPLSGGQGQTLQTHLCLLPQQLSTFARYAGFAFVCIVLLTIRAFLVPILKLEPFALEPGPGEGPSPAALPVFKAKVDDYDNHRPGSGYGYSGSSTYHSPHHSSTRDRSSSMHTTPGIKPNGLAAQARNAPPPPRLGRYNSSHKERSGHSGNGNGRWGWAAENGVSRAGPKIEISMDGDDDYYDGGKSRWKAAGSRGRGTLRLVLREFWTTAWRVAWMVLGVYAYLAWKG